MRQTLAAGSLRQIWIFFNAQSTVFPSKLSARLFVDHSVPTCLDVNALRSILKCFSVILQLPGLYMQIWMHIISQPEESIFRKGKMCSEHQLSYIDTEVIKANLWFKSRGYYNETWELRPRPQKYFYIHTPPTDTRTTPEIQAKVQEILFVVAKQNIPEPLKSTCIISAASSTLFCISSSFTRQMPFSHVRQLLHQGCLISSP